MAGRECRGFELNSLSVTMSRVSINWKNIELTANDPGRSVGSTFAALNSAQETVVLGAADDTDSQDTDDVEANQTVEDELGDSGDGSSRVLDLSGGNGDHVGAGNGESGVENNLPPSAETAEGSGGMVAEHGLAVLPVTETVGVTLGVTTAHGNEREKDETEEEEDLHRGHDKLGLAIPLDSHNVQRCDDDQSHCNPNRGVDIRFPKSHECCNCGEFDTDQHYAVIVVRILFFFFLLKRQ